MQRVRHNYIIGINRRLFELVLIREMSNYSSYHFSLQAHLLQIPTLFHAHYLWGRCASALSLPSLIDISMKDTKFQALKFLELPCPPFTRTPFPLWIL